MKETKFFICKHCGNLVGLINDSGVPLVCCGEEMQRLEPGVTEASREKHIPVVTVNGDTVAVNIGEAAHPMAAEHSIQWVYLLTENGGQRKNLAPGQAPQTSFALNGEKPLAVFAYCNLHGLWKTEI